MKRSALGLATALAVVASHAKANLIVDGGFESPATQSFITVNLGDATLAPWEVTRNTVDVVINNGGGPVGDAYEGTQYLDLDGTPGPGEIRQTFTTTPGTLYSLFFAYANHYIQQPQCYAFVRLYQGGGSMMSETIIGHSTSQPGDLDWTPFNSQFVATSTSTTLEFSSIGPPDNGGIFLDAVSVEQVPEPHATGLLGISMVALFRRRRSKKTD